MPKQIYDVIVIGTGAGGGMAIKTLCEAGLIVPPKYAPSNDATVKGAPDCGENCPELTAGSLPTMNAWFLVIRYQTGWYGIGTPLLVRLTVTRPQALLMLPQVASTLYVPL